MGLHLAIVAGAHSVVASVNDVTVRLLCSLAIGNSLASLVFLAHDLSHGSIMKRSSRRYMLEVVLWGLNLIPITMWKLLHNESHHAHANTIKDPDRFFVRAELEGDGSTLRRCYTNLFFPHRHSARWKPLVGLHFLTYVARHMTAVAYPGHARPAVVTAKPRYSSSDRLIIVCELVAIALVQLAVLARMHWSASAYLFASPLPLLVTSCIAMAYIWTNHYLHPLRDEHNALASSTSVDVLPIFDHIHSNFSYHTEHHLFPAMSSRYYPALSKLLCEHYPRHYQRVPFRTAWRDLWRGERHVAVLMSESIAAG